MRHGAMNTWAATSMTAIAFTEARICARASGSAALRRSARKAHSPSGSAHAVIRTTMISYCERK
ncbi:hypothetical protein D3C86_1765570 [compost metagenome]